MISRQILFALMLLAPLTHAQIPLPGLNSGVPKAEAELAPVDSDPRSRAETQLAEARRQQEAGQLQEGGTTGVEGLPISDRQRLLDRLVLAYSERLKLLEELENLKKSPPEKARQQVLLAEFSGSPPYSALRVDALRDEYDALGNASRVWLRRSARWRNSRSVASTRSGAPVKRSAWRRTSSPAPVLRRPSTRSG